MEAKELRIGNYVNINNVTLYKVDMLYLDYVNLKYWNPVPLTEKWLLSFGFDKSVIFFMKESMNIEFIENGCLFSLDGEYEVFIEYVHQIQNLYFALSGKELTI